MNEETVNQEINTQEDAGRTFTQAELDAIVGDRLKRERQKYPDYEAYKEKALKFDEMEEARKSDLQKAEEARDSLKAELDKLKAEQAVKDVRAKIAEEMGIPASLLTETTEEGCKAQAQAILDYAGRTAPAYPSVKDGGEVAHRGKQSTRDQFAQWFNKINN